MRHPAHGRSTINQTNALATACPKRRLEKDKHFDGLLGVPLVEMIKSRTTLLLRFQIGWSIVISTPFKIILSSQWCVKDFRGLAMRKS